VPDQPPGGRQAAKAVADSRDRLARQQERWPEVREVTRSLTELRRQNNFAALIEAAFRSER
jgi:hypothetical protein